MFLTMEQQERQIEEREQARSLAFKNVFLCQVEKVEKLSEKINLLKREANLTEEEIAILKYYL